MGDLAMFRQPIDKPFEGLRQTFDEKLRCNKCRALRDGIKEEKYTPNGMGFAVAIDRNQRGKKSRKVVALPDVLKHNGTVFRKTLAVYHRGGTDYYCYLMAPTDRFPQRAWLVNDAWPHARQIISYEDGEDLVGAYYIKEGEFTAQPVKPPMNVRQQHREGVQQRQNTERTNTCSQEPAVTEDVPIGSVRESSTLDELINAARTEEERSMNDLDRLADMLIQDEHQRITDSDRKRRQQEEERNRRQKHRDASQFEVELFPLTLDESAEQQHQEVELFPFTGDDNRPPPKSTPRSTAKSKANTKPAVKAAASKTSTTAATDCDAASTSSSNASRTKQRSSKFLDAEEVRQVVRTLPPQARIKVRYVDNETGKPRSLEGIILASHELGARIAYDAYQKQGSNEWVVHAIPAVDVNYLELAPTMPYPDRPAATVKCTSPKRYAPQK
jgi:hypothetical protein